MKINPDAAGFDAERLENVTRHLQRSYIEPGKIAGCQTAVARHGTVAYFSSLGSMDLERQRPVADDTIWRIYSMTKPFTGVALMTLYEQGLFQLDTPVHRFIPQWRNLKVREQMPDGSTQFVRPHRPMTVKDALMHTTGLGWGIDPPLTMDKFLPAMTTVRGGRDGTLQTMVDYLADRPLEFHPGEHWLYGLSTDLCGYLVEVLSGQRFDEYLRDHLFEPLGLHDTGFTVPDAKLDRFAANYGRRADKTLKLLDDPERSSYRRQPAFLSGGGGLVSTTGDYLRFCQMLLNGGEIDGVRILGRKTVELMRLNHLPGGRQLSDFALPNGYGETGFDGVGFGLTMAVDLGPVATARVGSTGSYYWGGAASTAFWIDPAEDLAVVFMTQLMPSGTFDFRAQLRSTIYPAIID